MVHHRFIFKTKEEARQQMTHLQNLFFQMKYCLFQRETYQKYRTEIESILVKE
jgi:predicted RNase H-like HicB family nuclease